MRTPREILFERHRQVEPKLDALRQNVIAALPASGSHQTREHQSRDLSLMAALIRKGWQEVIWPSRRAWACLGALWVAVLAANLEMKGVSGTTVSVRPAAAREMRLAVEEQRRLLAELLQPAWPPKVAVPRPQPGPRSERPTISKPC